MLRMSLKARLKPWWVRYFLEVFQFASKSWWSKNLLIKFLGIRQGGQKRQPIS